MKVLVVDDQEGMRRMLARAAASWGWQGEFCASVAEARAALRADRFDLALCDADLPDGDGVALAAELRAANPGLAVVVMSGDPENLERAGRQGLSALLQKPFELAAVRALAAEL